MEGGSVNRLPGAIFTIPVGNAEDGQKDKALFKLVCVRSKVTLLWHF